ncbi:hypothetical protein [Erythrobacter sp. YT30]|uniref:hypothetical protein n=1 Tax=Erythrobacter sp. YT30 TaxID=1735012 RepID=UPI00076C0629|nr:hypothetical protein [Erythrobacter sp. YT30]KWV91516.1 hypothetical protein AUC45_09765 [Erythrobacter sp. YT30]
MNGQIEKRRGVFGRGPAFWGVMVFLSTTLIVALAVTGAIEQRTPLILLTMVPCILALIMFRSAYNLADGDGGACVGKGEAQKRYIKRTAIFTSLYVATFALLIFSERELAGAPEAKFGLALLPGLAIIGIFWALARLIIEEADEFMRMLVIRQALIASGFALSAATVWGFLEWAEVVPHVDAFWWSVAFFLGLFAGGVANRIQYEAWGAL